MQYFESNNLKSTYQNSCEAAKEIRKGKSLTLNANIKKEEMSEVNAVNHQKVVKEQQTKHIVSRRTDMKIKSRNQQNGKPENREHRTASQNSEHSVKFIFRIEYFF